MYIVIGLAGLVIGAVAGWRLARGYSAAKINQLRTRLEERIGYWQSETERARASAAQVADRTAAWVAGSSRGVRMSCPWREPWPSTLPRPGTVQLQTDLAPVPLRRASPIHVGRPAGLDAAERQ